MERMRKPSSHADHFGTVANWYSCGRLAGYVTSRRSAGANGIHMLEARQPAGDLSDPPLSCLGLAMDIDGRKIRADLGAGRVSAVTRPGSIILAMPDVGTSIFAEAAHTVRVFAIPRPMLQAVGEALGVTTWDFGRLHAAPLQDSHATSILGNLWLAAEESTNVSRLFVDTAALSLIAHLLLLAGRRIDKIRGGLAPWQMHRVREYIDAHMNENPGLDDLAAVVGLSRAHFARAFRRENGISPHQFLIERRVERAKSLLCRRGEGSIAQIAEACGFADQSHMTMVFRKVTGTTPAAYRRQALS